MTTTYPRTADVEFHVPATDATITLTGVAYDWDPRTMSDMDAAGVFAALRHLRKVGLSQPNMQLICIATSPAREGVA